MALTYRFESSFVVEQTPFPQEVAIFIDQLTSLGLYWTRITMQIVETPDKVKTPADRVIILDDRILTGTELNMVHAPSSFTSAGPVFQGNFSLAFQADLQEGETWTARLRFTKPIDVRGYKVLRFAFHPGTAVGDSINVTVWGSGRMLIKNSEGTGIDTEKRAWQVIEIPLETDDGYQIDQISSIIYEGNLNGIFYLDDLRLSATPILQSTTAVTENQTALLPSAIYLAQNYPNPFNGETTIYFTLPTFAEVGLTVYNLIGQKVATLMKGGREAGVYTVKWDGRDGTSREMASGIYFCRLQVGKQIETRKLLLLR